MREARTWRRHLALVLLMGLVGAPLALLTPLPVKIVVDYVLGGRPLPDAVRSLVPAAWMTANALLIAAAALVLVAALLQNLDGYLSWMLQLYVGEKLTLTLKARLLAHMQRLSLLYHDSRGVPDSLYRLQYDAPAIQVIVVQGLMPLATSALTVAAMLYVIARVSWLLALVAAINFPLLVVAGGFYRRHLRARWEDVKRLETQTMSVLHETLGALRVVKAFGQEARHEQRFVDQANHSLREQLRVVGLESAFGLLVIGLSGAGAGFALYLGVRQVQAGAMTLGSLLLVIGYLAQLYKPLETVSKNIASIQASIASSERVFSVLDEAHEVPEADNPRSLGKARGEIAFEHVQFAYRPDHPVLHPTSFRVAAGTRVGISGPTGSGKTTLVNLLPRFYDPGEGRVLLDGIDLRDYRLADLRKQFSIVLQEPVLFSTTIAENIAYGRPEATHDEVVAAARAANALDFIQRLPQGLDTPVGERGMSLSGGERQRLALARAFLKDAPILILDEPTSSVDVASEAAILDALERLAEGRTTFMIAHRLDTLERCDLRLFVEAGRVSCERTGQGDRAAGSAAGSTRR